MPSWTGDSDRMAQKVVTACQKRSIRNMLTISELRVLGYSRLKEREMLLYVRLFDISSLYGVFHGFTLAMDRLNTYAMSVMVLVDTFPLSS